MQSCDIFCSHEDTVSDFTNMNAGSMLHGYGYVQCHWLFCLFSGGVYIAFVVVFVLFCLCVFVCVLLFGGRRTTPCGVVILTICVQMKSKLKNTQWFGSFAYI